jgi:putative FmdB family regulatory protein
MPIFEYVCEDCGSKFEKLVRNGVNGVHCPSCGQEHLKQQFSTFSAHANGASHARRASGRAARPTCAGGTSTRQHGKNGMEVVDRGFP